VAVRLPQIGKLGLAAGAAVGQLSGSGNLNLTYSDDWVEAVPFGASGQVYEGFGELSLWLDERVAMTGTFGYRQAKLDAQDITWYIDVFKRPDRRELELDYTGYFLQIGLKTYLF
jgi:hypothetical protein